MTRCKMVHGHRGYYQEIDVETEDWNEVKSGAEVKRIESLRGWGRWNAAYLVADFDGVERVYFVEEDPKRL